MKELEDLADAVKNELNLAYDAGSVKFIEGFIEKNKVNLAREQWPGLIDSLGVFKQTGTKAFVPAVHFITI